MVTHVGRSDVYPYRAWYMLQIPVFDVHASFAM